MFENPIVILENFENFKIKNFESKKNNFLKLTKNVVNSFDAEKAVLSIGEVSRAIPTLLHRF